MQLKHIPIDKIRTKDNVRSEHDGELGDLVDSIEQHDVLQPILVTPQNDQYVVVTGHRRLAAMKARNEATIPCIIRTDISEADRVWIQLVENNQRKQMSAAEYVEVFERLKRASPGLSNAKIARMMGRSSAWIGHQYEAVKLTGVLVSEGEVPAKEAKKLTAGQAIGKAQKAGLTVKGARQARDISVQCINSTTINVRCRDVIVTGRVLEILDTLRDEIRAEAADT